MVCMANSMKQTTKGNYTLPPVRGTNMKINVTQLAPIPKGQIANCLNSGLF